ncbi:YgfZ/GcvT domain-containing protein [Microbacterium keratanolyticum]|uniref:CAF17-like 4Fe-4S cluster assembly/insertion protein YgfZ n=1 Tax=Microbacterium keratanolyticum TaxID=67574 RepID=UPI00363EF2C9
MSAFSQIPGAVLDHDVVSHFGDPTREQRALDRGTALSPLGDRTIVEVEGADRLTWLDSITSQSLLRLQPGDSTELLVLDPQGRVEHAAGVVDDGVSTWLIADAGDAPTLAAWLKRMVFRARAVVTVRDDLSAVGIITGGVAEELAVGAAITPHEVPLVWSDPWNAVQPGGHQYHLGEDHPGAEYAWRIAIVDADATAALVARVDARADATWAGALAAEALRVAAWRPRWAREVDDRSIPHETDWIRSAVHLSKGCYRGQETVAKVHNLGHPPRRLTALHLDGSDSIFPAPGDVVLAGDDEVGHITSVARHHELGPIALAILSRRAPADALVVRTADGDVAASQEIIVPAEAGATANVPRLTRLSRRPTAPDPRDA